MNQASTKYKGKKYTQYQIDQKQRYIERQIRKYKRRAKLEKDSGLDNSKSVSFVKKWQKKLREFVEETNNQRDYSREYISDKKSKTALENWLSINCKNVTDEYISKVTPNNDEVEISESVSQDDSFENDKAYAEWVQRTIGGHIKMLSSKGADYLWEINSESSWWELKSPIKFNSISNRVKSSYERFDEVGEIGGMFFDFTNIENASYGQCIDKTLREIFYKGKRFEGQEFYIIFSADDEIISVYKIKKIDSRDLPSGINGRNYLFLLLLLHFFPESKYLLNNIAKYLVK